MATRIINKFGVLTGWNNLTVNVLGRDLEGITELEYSDEKEIESAMGAGEYPVGKEMKNYKADASMTIYYEELRGLQSSLPAGVRLQDVPFEIIAQYEAGGVIQKDIVRNVNIKKIPVSTKNGEGKIVCKLDLHTSHIDWNVR